MSAVPKRAAAGRDVFAPDVAADKFEWQTGERRKVEAVDALPLRWPTTPKERFDLFDAWHDVAMQVLRRAKVGLHVAAAAKKVTQWTSGTIEESNAELAARSGYPSEKTISREVQAYVSLGLFIPTYEWKRPNRGKFITVRKLILALPMTLPEGIRLPDGGLPSLDTRGPDLEAVSLDTRGPDPLDISGPATIDHKEGAGDATA